jgi:hypothetical protein
MRSACLRSELDGDSPAPPDVSKKAKIIRAPRYALDGALKAAAGESRK